MISIDDFLKLILVLAIVFAIVGISFEFMRLIHKVVDILQDVRHPINNVSELTDYALEDYIDARTVVREGASSLSSVKKYLDNPLLIGGAVLTAFSKFRDLSKKKE